MNKIVPALRLLGNFWLEEIGAEAVQTIKALPELAQTAPNIDAGIIDDLAVEYQRLFGFNLPPYESVFIDPSAMLMAPATARVQRLYQQGQWRQPLHLRSGASDHLGLELLALAEWLETGRYDLANQLQTAHLALWAPLFVLTLRRLKPHAFYRTLGELTLELVLTTLPEVVVAPDRLFPDLPPAPVYKGSGDEMNDNRTDSETDEPTLSLRGVIKHFLPARDFGLFLTREDVARISQALDLPLVMGERFRMLDSLFRLAGQYDLISALFEQFEQMITEAGTTYEQVAMEHPNWRPYAQAWRGRLRRTQALFEEFEQIIAGHEGRVM